ncbi:hypothetical protein AT1G53542 [Arabidopsis thaliana]|uniref:At1g53545 n=1 Tax=Arabidopsis thaliana TaxID=3702 RepID=Q84WL5_ARATH|nr:uncharacterized protein AT1G53542 [Arabidopsis thaliana]AAO24529.1 At1g53545 [Arabidopsis thaliana]AEE32956.1 hypothetical protein AT1G53542 [Arabidopsis thaliana]|eukprot:NP_001117482.1 hypothetical protein AT1G53542 [Arabidopsis thaliana]
MFVIWPIQMGSFIFILVPNFTRPKFKINLMEQSLYFYDSLHVYFFMSEIRDSALKFIRQFL